MTTTPDRYRYRIKDLPAHIAARINVSPASGCWVKQGRRDKGGYAQIKWKGRVRRVHSVVWELLVGPIPEGHQLNHVKSRGCVSNACCWPAHLEPVQQGAGRRAQVCDHAAGPYEVGLPVPAIPDGVPLVIHLHIHIDSGEQP
jgi:hypothetical protein